jgi:hypothetical protein
MNILVSFLNLLLYIAIIIFVAMAIKWLITSFMGWPIDPGMLKWAQIIVGLLCLIAVAVWLTGVLGGGAGLPHFWRYSALTVLT